MKLQDLTEWTEVRDIPQLTDGLVSRTHAKRVFRERSANGLKEAGGAALIGKVAMVHLPTFLDLVFNKAKRAA